MPLVAPEMQQVFDQALDSHTDSISQLRMGHDLSQLVEVLVHDLLMFILPLCIFIQLLADRP